MLITVPADPELPFRLTLAVMIIVVVVIGLPRRIRADRVGGPVSIRNDPRWFWILMALLGPPLAGACLGYLSKPSWVEFAQVNLPRAIRWCGVPAAALGLGLFEWMFRHLGLNVTSTATPRADAALVTTGPYRWVRHPMYSATLILVVAVSLLTANLIVMGGGVGMFSLLAARSRAEEEQLRKKFGEAYRRYQERTGRFFPKAKGVMP
mgnify:CR=1 FL=1